jgi:cytochrome c nitrite reductase small subunit
MRHLWLAIREGIVEHRRALLTIAAVVIGALAVLHAVFYVVSADSRVCASCHIMDPYIEAWRNSSHGGVACVQCHSEWRLAISGAWLRYAAGVYSTQLRAEVPDGRCLACHEHQDLDSDQTFLKNIHFSHRDHLGEARRGKRLHCTSCHSGTGVAVAEAGHETHVRVDESVCFTCHFKGAEKGRAATGCLVCHGPPTTVVTHQGFQFDHGSYLKRDVRCDLCHVEVVRGDAAVPRERCASCHVSRIAAFDDTESVHEIHLKQRQIDCKRCHNRMEHGKVQMAAALGEGCESCHRPAHTAQEQMYIGIGGQGVPDMPSTMFLARVACDSCHGEPGGDPRKGAERLRTSCVTCHGQGFDRMVDDWVNEVGALLADVGGALARAETAARAAGPRSRDLLAKLDRARHNVDFVRRSRGEHNIRYAVELLRVARTDVAGVLATTGGGGLPQLPVLASASGYCRVCHSTSHLGTRLPFGGMQYDHNLHVGAGLGCETCHSVEEHGKTTIAREQCMSCHHGGGQQRTCESCHAEQASLYRGELSGTGVKGDPDVMARAEVECTGCHDLGSREPVVKAVQAACVACHEAGFDEMAVEWINDDQRRVQDLAVELARAQSRAAGGSGALAAANRQAIADAERIHRALVAAKGAHNSALAADAYDRAKKLLSR